MDACAYCEAPLGAPDRCEACGRGQPVSDADAAGATYHSTGVHPLIIIGIILVLLGVVVPLISLVGSVMMVVGVVLMLGDLDRRLAAIEGPKDGSHAPPRVPSEQ